jgi:hypothetical protein
LYSSPQNHFKKFQFKNPFDTVLKPDIPWFKGSEVLGCNTTIIGNWALAAGQNSRTETFRQLPATKSQ